MGRILGKFIIVALMLLGLPMAGIICAGFKIGHYLEFPPATRYVDQAPFSWGVFFGMLVFVAFCVSPFLFRAWISRNIQVKQRGITGHFPWWGYVGAGLGIAAWVMAWSRFEWFQFFQPHTFTPLWLSYIIVVNALTYRRSGTCMMISRPGYFLLLFPVSSAFWWFFEYLNRFVQNWYYIGVERFSPVEYFVFASLSFATVLPAVLGTRDYLLTFPLFFSAFGKFGRVNFSSQRSVAAVCLFISGAGLACIGVFPNVLYPLLWISPMVVIVSLQILAGEKNIFSSLKEGDWRCIIPSAPAALVCGFFWEMWNFYSFAKWEYSVPYVHRFVIFEMPVIGFAGYLPFGLECAVIADFLFGPRK